jgi:hypothetical protein
MKTQMRSKPKACHSHDETQPEDVCQVMEWLLHQTIQKLQNCDTLQAQPVSRSDMVQCADYLVCFLCSVNGINNPWSKYLVFSLVSGSTTQGDKKYDLGSYFFILKYLSRLTNYVIRHITISGNFHAYIRLQDHHFCHPRSSHQN